MKYFDLHTHTTHSDGSASIEYLEAAAARKGYGLGISDHLFCGGMDTLGAVEAYLEELEGHSLLKGCEANMGEEYSLPDRLAQKLDYVIASVHSVPDLQGGRLFLGNYFGERAGEAVRWARDADMARSGEYLEVLLWMVEHTMRSQRVDIYGHCTVLPFCEALAGTAFLRDWEEALIALCKKYGVALEISGLWKEPDLEMVRRAKARGIKFTLGSDCHLLRDACNLDYAIDVAQRAGLGEEDFFVPAG